MKPPLRRYSSALWLTVPCPLNSEPMDWYTSASSVISQDDRRRVPVLAGGRALLVRPPGSGWRRPRNARRRRDPPRCTGAPSPRRRGGDGTFERADFACDRRADGYVCPAGKTLKQFHRPADAYATLPRVADIRRFLLVCSAAGLAFAFDDAPRMNAGPRPRRAGFMPRDIIGTLNLRLSAIRGKLEAIVRKGSRFARPWAGQ